VNWTFWIILSVVLAFGAGIGTLVWWKVGDQWADAEHKKFGAGPREPKGPDPTVITGFDMPGQPGERAERPRR